MTTTQPALQAIIANQVKDIKTAFATLKPHKVTPYTAADGNRTMTVKEAIFALAPTLERIKSAASTSPNWWRNCTRRAFP